MLRRPIARRLEGMWRLRWGTTGHRARGTGARPSSTRCARCWAPGWAAQAAGDAGQWLGTLLRRRLGGSAAGMAWWAGERSQERGCASARDGPQLGRVGVGRARGQMGWRGGREGELGLFYFFLLIIFFYSYSYLYTRKSYKLNGYTPRQ
jgi:hypothetical protein